MTAKPIALRIVLLTSLLLTTPFLLRGQSLNSTWDFPEEMKEDHRFIRAGDDVSPIEVEPGLLLSVDTRGTIGTWPKLEARFNFQNSPWDIGAQFLFMNQDSDSCFFGDRNWRNWHNIAPFAGVGLGLNSGVALLAIFGSSGSIGQPTHGYLSLRGGCEFFDWLRFTAEYRQAFFGGISTLSLQFGFVIGGRHRK